jgi:hypothetical protein
LQSASFAGLARCATFPAADAVFLATSFSWWSRRSDVPALAIPIDGLYEWLKPDASPSVHHQLKLVAKKNGNSYKSEESAADQKPQLQN